MLQCCSVVECDSTGLFVIRVSLAGGRGVATLSRIVMCVCVDRLAVLVFGSRCLVVQSLGEFLEFVGPRLALAAEPERDSRVW